MFSMVSLSLVRLAVFLLLFSTTYHNAQADVFLIIVPAFRIYISVFQVVYHSRFLYPDFV